MKLIVGLGNPGPKYQFTRHNIGFLFIDALVESLAGGRHFRQEFKAETQKFTLEGQPVIVCKPQTFMNLSGESVQPLLKFYGIAPEDMLVVHDEVDQPFGVLKFQFKRGHGGHNGIRNIHQLIGTDAYGRLRLGVGRPPVFVDDSGARTRPALEVVDWVLGNFGRDETAKLPDFLDLGIQGTKVWASRGIGQASTEFNGKAV